MDSSTVVVRTLWELDYQIGRDLAVRRDATFHVDATRMSQRHATRNLTTVHNTILSLFARLGCHNADHAQTRRRLGVDLRLAFSLLISAHPGLRKSHVGQEKFASL